VGGMVKKISNQDFMELRQDERQSSLVKVARLIIRGEFERARELMLSVECCVMDEGVEDL
jgi:hypothetical protein